jgi:hypothetical protein
MVAAVTISEVVEVVTTVGWPVCGAAFAGGDGDRRFAGGGAGIFDWGVIAVCAAGFICLAFRFDSA